MSPETVAYSFLTTALVSLLYVSIVAVEARSGKRLMSGMRGYLDRVAIAMVKRVSQAGRRASTVFRRGEETVEKDLIDPLTAPAEKAKRQYQALKTGRGRLRRSSVKNISPYLRDLVKRHR
ncbi:MAG: hypothetical protein OYG31_02485 [Candidatus Kaiserbacteria bacterium]|nr:hypothetical protein [Candidatus Kaiserbacteria bacterium]